MFISTRDVRRHLSLTFLFMAVNKIVMITSKIPRTTCIITTL